MANNLPFTVTEVITKKYNIQCPNQSCGEMVGTIIETNTSDTLIFHTSSGKEAVYEWIITRCPSCACLFQIKPRES